MTPTPASGGSTEPDDPALLDTLLGTLTRPARTFLELAELRSSKHGAAAIALLGTFWGLLSFLLWSSGRPPHAIWLPVDPRQYYLWQGLLMLPLLTGLWWIFSEIAHRLAGPGPEAGTRNALGFAYAVPMLVHVAAEMIVYLVVGLDRLPLIAAISLPLASLWVWVLAALALRVLHRASWPRAFAASFVGLFVQAAAGALVLR
ncbi:MAG: hypothetical protein KC619_10230 [Myxococcales bacterium]|nr:hypothetical protein [Myxococcales bacterium]